MAFTVAAKDARWPSDWSHLKGMSFADQIDHLKWLVEEMVSPPAEYDPALECLSPQQRRIVARLLKARGETVRHGALLVAANIYGDPDQYAAESNNIQAQISNARKKLASAGVPVVIETTWGVGYRARVS